MIKKFLLVTMVLSAGSLLGYNEYHLQMVQDGWRSFDGFDLSNAPLQGYQFYGARITNTKFDGARLEGADFRCAYIQNSTFCRNDVPPVGCTSPSTALRNAQFQWAQLIDCDFSGAVALNANFSDATIDRCLFVRTKLNDAFFVRSKMTVVDMRYARLQGASFYDAQMNAINFTGCWLRNTDFRTSSKHILRTNLAFGPWHWFRWFADMSLRRKAVFHENSTPHYDELPWWCFWRFDRGGVWSENDVIWAD